MMEYILLVIAFIGPALVLLVAAIINSIYKMLPDKSKKYIMSLRKRFHDMTGWHSYEHVHTSFPKYNRFAKETMFTLTHKCRFCDKKFTTVN